MSRKEMGEVAERELREFSAKAFSTLRDYVGQITRKKIRGSDSKVYQVAVQVVWDDQPGGDLRIIVSVDDKGWRAFVPITRSVIIQGS